MLQHNLGAVLGVVVPVVLALAVVLVAVPLGLVPVLALERVFLACEDLAAAQSGLAVASKTEHDVKPQLHVGSRFKYPFLSLHTITTASASIFGVNC